MSNIHPYLERLAAEALPDGGWGYAPHQLIHLEPTCLALLALSLDAERYREVIARGRSSLERSRAADGTFHTVRGREEALWPTALVLYVQAALGESPEVLQRTAAAVLSYRGRVPEDPGAAEMHDIDIHIVGWPWALDTFAWVEPTAWACLALRRAGFGSDPRVDEGLRLLLDRATDAGGINYGNRHVFGRLTEPLPGPTALMLLALQGHGDHPRVQAAIRYLQREIETDDDLEHLCWTKLALDALASSVASAASPVASAASPVASAAGALANLDDRIIAAHKARTGAT